MEDQATSLHPDSPAFTTSVGEIANTNEIVPTNVFIAARTSTSKSLSKSQVKNDGIVFITIGLVGIVDNLLTILVMLLHKPLRHRLANYFLINKSIQDLLTGVFLVLMNSVEAKIQLQGVALELYCRLWSSRAIFLGLFTSSLFSLAAVTFEKYLEIAHPIQHRVKMTKTRVLWSIAILTALAMAFKVGYISGSAGVVNGSCKTSYPNFAAKAATATANLFVEFLLPLMVIAYSYIGMAMSLRRTVQPTSTVKDINPRMIRARRNIIKTLFTVVLAFVICVSYKQFLLFFSFYNLYKVDYDSWGFIIAQTMAFLTCCIDPIIYFVQYEEFRRGALKLFGKALRSRKTMPANMEDNEFSIKTVEVF